MGRRGSAREMRAIAASSSTALFRGRAPCSPANRCTDRSRSAASARDPPVETSTAASRHAARCRSHSIPAAAQAVIASRQSPAWSALPSARPRSAAYSAAVAGWRVSRSPRRWNATPGSSSRALASRSSESRWRRTSASSRPSRARSTRSPIARVPQTISSSRARRSTALTGRTRSMTASAPPGSPQASSISARRGPAIISGRSSSVGMTSRARARWPRAASSEPLRTARTAANNRIPDSYEGLPVVASPPRSTCCASVRRPSSRRPPLTEAVGNSAAAPRGALHSYSSRQTACPPWRSPRASSTQERVTKAP